LDRAKTAKQHRKRAIRRSSKHALAVSTTSRYYLETLRFDWDERKNKANRRKNGIWFEEAQRAFDDPLARLFDDPGRSDGEERLILLGVSAAARLLVVVHCYRESDLVIGLFPRGKQPERRPDFMRKEYDFSKLKELKNRYAGKKKAVGINLSPEVVDYFKALAAETGLPYQKLIDLYLLDCAKRRKKLSMRWVA
jgi:uncharacterized DUF497 family protein